MAEAILADLESSGIYQIRNLVNGKRYIGSAKCFRVRWISTLAIYGLGSITVLTCNARGISTVLMLLHLR